MFEEEVVVPLSQTIGVQQIHPMTRMMIDPEVIDAQHIAG
jgi:hypothetical protein